MKVGSNRIFQPDLSWVVFVGNYQWCSIFPHWYVVYIIFIVYYVIINISVFAGDFNAPIWLVSESARNAHCSPRLDNLSDAKKQPSAFVGERTVQWPVSSNAMNAVATLRLQQLSRPKSGRMRVDDHDPYKVTFAAKNARATPRVSELCEPLPRKVRSKKM